MSDVVVHRCVVRIRRTSGWSWGASPDALVAAATRALPDLVMARLPAVAASLAAPVHLAQPIKVQLAMTTAELVALATSSNAASTPFAERLSALVAEHVANAIARDQPGTRDALPAPDVDPGIHGASDDLTPRSRDPADAAPARRAVRTWWHTGVIVDVLARMEPAAVERLHGLLLAGSSRHTTARSALVAMAEAAAARVALSRTTREECLKLRIAIIAAMVDASPQTPSTELLAVVDHVAPLASDALPGAEAHIAIAADPPRSTSGTKLRVGSVDIRSALPFLLLPSLHHARWLDTASALLSANDLDDLAFALAGGLAAKVLDAPGRQWSRSSADRAVISAFLGTEDLLDDGTLAAAARRLAPVLDPLDASLRAVIARARRPRPLILARDGEIWLLLDTDGMIVLARDRALRTVLAAGCAAPILVPAAHADPATLEMIDLANHRFITDARPARHESWRVIRGVTGPLATNDTAAPSAQLAADAADIESSAALARELVEVLSARPVLPRDPLARLDATCALAATAALADLGARLFPTEPTTPVLVLTRFRDLDANVHFDPERIRVRVPLGRRHADLMKHGVLGELHRIPWLAGRTLDLGGA